jgi:hypothetical protein
MKQVIQLLLLLLGLTAHMAEAETLPPVPENVMKAAYLYNFAQLAVWPAQTDTEEDSFNLCVVDQDDVLAALEPMRGKLINGRPLRPIKLTDIKQTQHCQMLFIGESDGPRSTRILSSVRGSPIVTVSDTSHLPLLGVMLSLSTQSKRLAFDVDLDAARRSQIQFSSRLLRLANQVTGHEDE